MLKPYVSRLQCILSRLLTDMKQGWNECGTVKALCGDVELEFNNSRFRYDKVPNPPLELGRQLIDRSKLSFRSVVPA